MKFRIVYMGSTGDPGKEINQPRGHVPVQTYIYDVEGNEMVRRECSPKGLMKVIPIANFTARIVRDFILADCPEQRRFEIHANLSGQRKIVIISALVFHKMNWILHHLGPQAIIYPGQQQHARAAIQALSGSIPQQLAFSHLGWQKVNEEWLYVDADGGISADGRHSELEVRLPEALSRYRVSTPDSQNLINSIRVSLALLSLAADRIMLPLLAGVYRAPLGSVDFSLFLTGPSGTFKTTLATLCQQHFGKELDAGHLPAHFESTAGALEELAFLAKDALMVIDDFVPTGGSGDGAVHALAERIFRSAANSRGRNRLNSSASLTLARPPRGLLLATGEDLPQGHSLRARLLTIPIGPGDVDRKRLGGCQKAANDGYLAMAMGAFLSWVARDYENRQRLLKQRASELRIEFHSVEVHARIPTAMAELHAAWEIWLEFAAETGAMDASEKQNLENRCRIALHQLATFQAKQSAPAAPQRNRSKRSNVIAMMERPEGASVQEMMDVTGWQRHTIFGFVSLLKHQTGVSLNSTKASDGSRRYRIRCIREETT